MAKQENNTTSSFNKAIKAMLDKRAASDPLFAEVYKREGKSIKECCNYIINEVQRKRDAEELRRNARAIAKYKELKGCYFGIVLKQGKLHASVLPDVEAFMQEGEAMRHCVFTNGYYKRKDCLIFSVRNTHNKRVATVEFDLKTFKVVQCRGKANSQPKEYDEILKMFQAGATKIQQAQQQSKAS